jgi:hypothetical protein
MELMGSKLPILRDESRDRYNPAFGQNDTSPWFYGRGFARVFFVSLASVDSRLRGNDNKRVTLQKTRPSE